MHVLAVRRHHGEHHQGDREGDLPRPQVRRRAAGHRQHDEDLVGGVGDRRERVAGENRQRDALRQQRLARAARSAACGPGGSAWRRRRHPRQKARPWSEGALSDGRCSVRCVHVVIMGCGRVGSTLARSLEDRNHTVSVIDSNADAFRRLGPTFGGTKVIGIGFDQTCCRRPASRRPTPSPPSPAATTPTSSPPGWPARPSGSSRSWPASTTRGVPRSTSGSASPPSRP